MPGQSHFSCDIQSARTFAAGQNNCFSLKFVSIFSDNLKTTLNFLYLYHVHVDFLVDGELIDLLLELSHQLIAFDKLIAHIILHAIGPVHLPTDITGNQEGIQLFAGGINRRRHAGRAAANYNKLVHYIFPHNIILIGQSILCE